MNIRLSVKRIKRIDILPVLCFLLLCGCSADINGTYSDNSDDSHTLAEEATHIVKEAAVTPDYLGTDDWNLDLFSESSIRFNNDLALVAAEMSEKAEEEKDNNIRALLKEYGLYAVETYNYLEDNRLVSECVYREILDGFTLEPLEIEEAEWFKDIETYQLEMTSLLEFYSLPWSDISKRYGF